jgi:hypothetical protein
MAKIGYFQTKTLSAKYNAIGTRGYGTHFDTLRKKIVLMGLESTIKKLMLRRIKRNFGMGDRKKCQNTGRV